VKGDLRRASNTAYIYICMCGLQEIFIVLEYAVTKVFTGYTTVFIILFLLAFNK